MRRTPAARTRVVPAAMPCFGQGGGCDRDADVYIFGGLARTSDTEGRFTVVNGLRGRELSDMFPEGARCADCALDELDGALRDARALDCQGQS